MKSPSPLGWLASCLCLVVVGSGIFLLYSDRGRPPRSASGAADSVPLSLSGHVPGEKTTPSGESSKNSTLFDSARLTATLGDEMDAQALEAAARLFADRDPNGGLRAADRLKSKDIRERFLKALFAQWGRRDGPGVTALILGSSDSTLGGIKAATAMVAAAMGWGQSDPAAASAWLGQQLQHGASQATGILSGLVGVMDEWGASAPLAAFAWLNEHPGLEQPRLLYSELGFGWAAKDLNGILASILQLPPDSDAREGMLSGALSKWSRESPAAAVEWFRSNIDPREVTQLAETVKSMGLALEHEDPPGALAFASSMPEPALRTDLMSSVLFPWMHEAPDVALEAVHKQLPEGDPVRAQVIANTLRVWTHLDPAKAGDWLANQPPSSERDQSVVVFSETVSVSEPQKAATWAASVQDPAARQAALTGVMREWIQTSPDACLQWCEQQAHSVGQPFVDQVRKMIAER